MIDWTDAKLYNVVHTTLTLLIKANKTAFYTRFTELYKNYTDTYYYNFVIKNIAREKPEKLADVIIDFFVADKTAEGVFNDFDYTYYSQSQLLTDDEKLFLDNIFKINSFNLKAAPTENPTGGQSGGQSGGKNFWQYIGSWVGENLLGKENKSEVKEEETKKVNVFVIIVLAAVVIAVIYFLIEK